MPVGPWSDEVVYGRGLGGFLDGSTPGGGRLKAHGTALLFCEVKQGLDRLSEDAGEFQGDDYRGVKPLFFDSKHGLSSDVDAVGENGLPHPQLSAKVSNAIE